MNNLIKLKNVSKNYISSKKIEILKNINYTFKSGKIYSLTGPSGSGKSTLLNLISLIDKPSSGYIKLDNEKINDNDIDQRDTIRSKKIGIIYQDKNLLADFTTLENVYISRLSLSDNKQRNNALSETAKLLKANINKILEANKIDIEKSQKKSMSNSFIDRLSLDKKRIYSIIDGLIDISKLEDPLNKVLSKWDRPNGLSISKISVPGLQKIIFAKFDP